MVSSKKKFKMGGAEFAAVFAFVVLLIVFSYNSVLLSGYASGLGNIPSGSSSEIIPTGVPEIYGAELSISYDDVSATNPFSSRYYYRSNE